MPMMSPLMFLRKLGRKEEGRPEKGKLELAGKLRRENILTEEIPGMPEAHFGPQEERMRENELTQEAIKSGSLVGLVQMQEGEERMHKTKAINYALTKYEMEKHMKEAGIPEAKRMELLRKVDAAARKEAKPFLPRLAERMVRMTENAVTIKEAFMNYLAELGRRRAVAYARVRTNRTK
ncbi:hypothetical protein HZC09_01330 [Candidatus Micrarchaeota archaeon]|nr:hypothetical protein [Candidatus Micrarchaeota archaeon]